MGFKAIVIVVLPQNFYFEIFIQMVPFYEILIDTVYMY